MTILILLILLFFPCNAASSPNVPIGHDIYNSVYKLAALGLVNNIMLTQRPLSKKEIATIKISVKDQIDNMPETGVKRVAQRELIRLTTWYNTSGLDTKTTVRYKLLDPFTLSYSYGGGDFIRPYNIPNSNGQEIDSSSFLGWKNIAWISLYDHFGVYGEMKGIEKNGEQSIRSNFNFWFSFFNIGLEAGKLSQWWGSSIHGSMLLSNNAPPMTAIRLFNIKPWKLHKSISLKVNTFVADLKENRDHSGVNLFGLRLTLLYLNKIEVGVSRMTMFGGMGIPKLSVKQHLNLYFSDPNQSGQFDVNELASIDFIWHSGIFNFGPDIYGELGGEDEAGLRPSKLGYVVGAYFPYLPYIPFLDLRLEYADNHVEGFPDVWYSHHVYTTGYRYKGDIIGHHMGVDARNIYIAFSSLTDSFGRIKVWADIKKDGLTMKNIQSDFTYGMNTHTIVNDNLTVILNYEFNTITNLNRKKGNNLRQHLISTRLSISY